MLTSLGNNVIGQTAERVQPRYSMPSLPIRNDYEFDELENSLIEKTFQREFVSFLTSDSLVIP